MELSARNKGKTRLAVLTLLAVLVAVMSSFAEPKPRMAHAAATGKFHVEGTNIIDPNGNVFIIKGTNVPGYRWTWPLDMNTDEQLHLIKDVWKFNTIRVNNNLGPNPDGYQQYQTDINQLYGLIDRYISNDIVVQIEAHDKSGSFYTDTSTPSLTDLANFHKDLAQRFKNHPKASYLWFNVMNEPSYGDNPVSSQYVTTHQRVIDAIRGTGNDSIIVVDGSQFGQDAITYDGSRVLDSTSGILTYGEQLRDYDPLKNIAFSVHMYGVWQYGDTVLSNGKTRFQDYVERVRAKNLALHIGEYGTSDGSNVPSLVKNYAWNNQLGRIIWSWYGGDSNQLTNTSGCNGGYCIDVKDGVTKPGNLTGLGSIAWDDTHGTPTSNIALNKTATSSSACNANEAAGKALDRNSYTKWCSTDATKWIEVDLGKNQTISKIVLGHAGYGNESASYNTKAYNIQVKADGASSYTTVVTVTNNASGTTTHDITPVTARYVRLNITQAEQNNNYAARIYEFEVHSPRNFALGGIVKADGTCGFNEGAGGAVDARYNYKWCSNTANQVKWMTVDMGAAKKISKFVVGHSGAGGEWATQNTYDFSILTSMDGVNWTSAVNVTGNTANTTTHPITPVTARYLKLNITKAENPSTGSNNARIYEFEAWGTD